MKAIVYRDFGSPAVLKSEDVKSRRPEIPRCSSPVRAAAVNLLDWYMVRGKPVFVRLVPGVRKTKRLGVDMAGQVEAVGRSVARFRY